MSISKEQIMSIIINDPYMSKAYNNNEGSFKNVVIPSIMNDNGDNLLFKLIGTIAAQAELIDNMMDNIALYGSDEMKFECVNSINGLINK